MPGTAFNPADWSGYASAAWTNPSSALTDHAGLIDLADVSLPAEWKAAVQSDGGDIRLTKGDGITELPIDLIEWDYNAGNPTGQIRFSWTGTLASSGSQQVFIWAGHGTAVAYDANETYGQHAAYRDDCELFLPLGEDPSSSAPQMLDRTANAIHGTSSGGMTSGDSVTGQVGRGLDFDGTDDYLSVGAAASNWTISFWASINNSIAILQYPIGLSGGGIFVEFDPADRWGFYDGVSSTLEGSTTAEGVWNQFVVTKSGTTYTLYLNGTNDGSGTRANATIVSLSIGRRLDGSWNFGGILDDVRIHSVSLPAAEIAHTFAAESDNAGFWGAWEWVPVASSVRLRRLLAMNHFAGGIAV